MARPLGAGKLVCKGRCVSNHWKKWRNKFQCLESRRNVPLLALWPSVCCGTLRMEKDDPQQIPERGDDPFASDELRQISEEISAEFPPPRLGTELVLLEVDPQRAHAYWNIDLEDYQDAKLDSGRLNPTMVLRMYDVSGVNFDGTNAREVFDTEIQGLQGQWYVDLWQHGRKYVADIGFRRADGSLAFIARSNEVQTPPAGPSSENDAALELVAAALSHEVAERVPIAQGQSRLSVMSQETVADISTQVIENDYPREYGASTPPSANRAPVEISWPEPEEILHNTPDIQQRVDKFYKELTEPESAISAAELRMEHEMESAEEPASMPPAPASNESPATGPVPLESYVNYSSFESGRHGVELEINTELHVYGRAKPGSDLVLFGQKVQIRPDGTFSIRKPLPQGAVVIPLLFTPNGDSK